MLVKVDNTLKMKNVCNSLGSRREEGNKDGLRQHGHIARHVSCRPFWVLPICSAHLYLDYINYKGNNETIVMSVSVLDMGANKQPGVVQEDIGPE